MMLDRWRREGRDTPVLVLTARDAVTEQAQDAERVRTERDREQRRAERNGSE